MTTLFVVLISVIMVILNVIVFCKSGLPSDATRNHSNPTDTSPRDTPRLRKNLNSVPIITTFLAILTIVISLLTVDVKRPFVLPLNGMLTEEYPEIEIKNDILVESYFTEDPHVLPAEGGRKVQGAIYPRPFDHLLHPE